MKLLPIEQLLHHQGMGYLLYFCGVYKVHTVGDKGEKDIGEEPLPGQFRVSDVS